VNYIKRTLAAAGVLAIIMLVPLTIRPASLLAEGPGALFKLTEACGQATSCAPRTFYICSTHNQDHNNYTCNTGCDNAPAPAPTP
jgi:hypothetical protein